MAKCLAFILRLSSDQSITHPKDTSDGYHLMDDDKPATMYMVIMRTLKLLLYIYYILKCLCKKAMPFPLTASGFITRVGLIWALLWL